VDLGRHSSLLLRRRRGCDRSTTASGAEGSGAEVSDRTGRPAETSEASWEQKSRETSGPIASTRRQASCDGFRRVGLFYDVRRDCAVIR
jgi:hypothetical protein